MAASTCCKRWSSNNAKILSNFRHSISFSRRSAYVTSQKTRFFDIRPGVTGVLLLHEGEPNSVEDAVQFRINRFREYFCLPRFSTEYLQYLAEKLKCYKSVQPFFRHSTGFHEMQKTLSKALELNLNRLLPELGPYRCYSVHIDNPTSFSSAFESIKNDAVSRVFVLPQYPHYWCFRSGSCINSLSRYITNVTEAAEPRRNYLRRWKSDLPLDETLKGTTVGCVHWSLVDRWPAHPALTDVYSRLIQTEIDYFPYDVRHEVAILFCAPAFRGYDQIQYKREVASACQRIGEQLQHKYPHRLGFYNTWSQFPLPLGRRGLIRVLGDLVKLGRPNVIVVPISSVTNGIDTEFILKPLLSEKVLKSVGAQYCRFVSPPNDHPAFVQGLAEIIKNHYVANTGPSSQFDLKCRYCFWPSCSLSRKLFADT